MGRFTEELLYDSETTLRLVDTVLDELQVMDDGVGRMEAGIQSLSTRMEQAQVDIADVPQVLLRAHAEIQAVLDGLRESRDLLEHTAVTKLHGMNDRLRQASSVTEVATTDIMDRLDRSLALVDRLDSVEDADRDQRAAMHGELRGEIFGVMGCLQFQDLLSQQLSHASGALMSLETRLAQIAAGLTSQGPGPQPGSHAAHRPSDFAPASQRDAAERQAVADEIFRR